MAIHSQGEVMPGARRTLEPGRESPGRPARGALGAAARTAGLAAGLAAASSGAWALEMDAGDDTALPEGTNLAVLYYQHVERDRLYVDGDKAPGRNKLDSDIGIARFVHYTKFAGMTINPQFLLPFGRMHLGGDLSGSASGVGDLILASVFWLVEKPESNTYFAVTPYVYLPTGNYDKNDALNLGENRWKGTLQLGYITGLTDKLLLDLYADVTVFGNNNEYGPNSATLKQDPLYQVQGWLRYKLSDAWDVRAGYFHTWGGETKVDGVSSDDRVRTSKYQVGTAWFYEPKGQLIFTYGQDVAVENGFRERSRLNFRWLKLF